MSVMFQVNNHDRFDHIGRPVTICPEMAQSWLDNQPQNRTVRTAAVDMFYRSFQAGEAIASPAMPIMLDAFGRLKDGQHRLMAIVKLGKPVTLWVLSVTAELLEAYHHNVPRKHFDTLKINHNVMNASAVASVALFVLNRLERPMHISGGGAKNKYTARELLEVYTRFGVDYVEITKQARSIYDVQIVANKLSPSELGYLLVQRPDITDWLLALLTDEGDRNEAQLACRRALSTKHPERYARLFLVSKAFNNPHLKKIQKETHVPDLVGGKFEGLE